jgi:hypothetical protein
MRDQTRFSLFAGIIVVVVVLAEGVPLLFPSNRTAEGSPLAAVSSSGPTATRALTIAYDPATGGFSYDTVHIAVPLGVRVIFTITNYDPGTAVLPAPTDASVVGTYGGTMVIESGSWNDTVGGLPAGQVSHTFSMTSPYYILNVPIPKAESAGTPSVVTFSEVFNTPGTFQWGCTVLCGDGPMNSAGMMFGSITVS